MQADSYTDKSEIYIPSGDNFRTLLGNSAEAVKQFISEDAVIAPRICLLYLCLWMLLVKKLGWLDSMKLDARRAFIKSSKGKLGGIVINTPAENLLPETYQKGPVRY
jgi:hypothetical protein